MVPDDCEECCSTVCCTTVGYVCCCRKMQKATKMKVLWAWLIVLASTSGVILYCAVYAPNDRLATPSDMIAVQDHISFLFCEELKIKSQGLQFNGYLVSGDLKVDNKATKQTRQSTAMFVSGRNYDYFAFYFLKGSRLTIKHCSKEFLTLYVIIGGRNFNDWKKYQFCDYCYFNKIDVLPKSNCTTDQYSTYELNVIKEEEYFIVYSNNNYEDVWIDLDIYMDRRVYDLENATSVCTETTECDLFLNAPKQTPLFWVMDYYNLGEHNHPIVTTECVPRIWAFLVIHGFPVLLIGILATFIIQRTHRTSTELNRVTERTPLLIDAALPPSYSTVMRDPPKYEDILRTCDPPPYTEVIAAQQSSPSQRDDNLSISSPSQRDDNLSISSPSQRDDNLSISSPSQRDDNLSISAPSQRDDNLSISSPSQRDDNLSISAPSQRDDNLSISAPAPNLFEPTSQSCCEVNEPNSNKAIETTRRKCSDNGPNRNQSTERARNTPELISNNHPQSAISDRIHINVTNETNLE